MSLTFDAMGRLTGVTKQAGGGTVPIYLSDARYYPGGQLQDLRLGTSEQGTNRWRLENGFGAPTNNGNITSQRLTLPGGAVVDSSLKYDERSRLQVVADGGNAAAGYAGAGGSF